MYLYYNRYITKRGENKLIAEVINNTQAYIDSFPKEDRKKNGQFFTSLETARYMASKAKVREKIKILDIGAGTGILTAALVERLLKSKKIKNIDITMYENDENVIPTLKHNIQIIRRECALKHIKVVIRIVQENFIIDYSKTWKKESTKGLYDIVISNPPYMKIGKSDEEAKIMGNLVFGQPNIYYLCMAMGAYLLKSHGDFIFIVPRSWTSGLYFKNFRKYFLENISLRNLHLFVSRDKVFESESVLQETMIVYGIKSKIQSSKICVTTSDGTNDFHDIKKITVKSKDCITKDSNSFILLPVSQEDVEVLSIMTSFENTLQSEGFAFKTGQVVEFRCLEAVRKKEEGSCVPLIRPFHFSNGYISFPVKTLKCQYIKLGEKTSLYLLKRDMLLLKRFTTKEEKRRLQPAMLLEDHFSSSSLAVENHVNYLVKENGMLSKDELYGIWAIFSSDIWDRYYRILNGSTQVNANEVNAMPMPSITKIREIGKKIQLQGNNTNFDKIIEESIDE